MGLKELRVKKTQVSLNLLEQGMRRLHSSITTNNKDFLDDVELCILLTTVVENLYAVSHFYMRHSPFCNILKILEQLQRE